MPDPSVGSLEASRTVWLAWSRGEFFGHDVAPGPSSLVGIYGTRDEALDNCWPKGWDIYVTEQLVGEAVKRP